MANVEKKKKEPDDPRVTFLSDYILKSMKIKIEKWHKMIGTGENSYMIKDFLNNAKNKKLIFTANTAGVLTPFLNEFPAAPKGKTIYFIRKKPVELTVDNMNEVLLFGDVSPNPIQDLSILIDYAIVPILTSEKNQTGWSADIVKNVNEKLQDIRNSITEVQGNMVNKTILPMPIGIKAIMQIRPDRNNAECPTNLQTQMEQIILKWSSTITEVLKDESYSILEEDPNAEPLLEINYWDSRMKNLENIYDQLCDIRVKTIAKILEKLNSVYFTAFQNLFQNVVAALHEALDVTLYLPTLTSHVETFEMTDFYEAKPLIAPILHVICLIWSNSRYYCTNERIAHLFKLINNMIITQASETLDPESIFQSEVDEGLLNINLVIDTITHYKKTFDEHKKKLKTYIKPNTSPQIWTLEEDIEEGLTIFDKLNKFLERLEDIKNIFLTANEFLKLEKVVVGGLNGRHINRALNNIFEEFNNLYKQWSNITFDPLNFTDDQIIFNKTRDQFNEDANNLELKLAKQFNLAFDECVTVIQPIKLIQMLGTLMHRPIIFAEIKDRYNDVVQLFAKELQSVKNVFSEGVKRYQENDDNPQVLPIDSGLESMCGTIKWVEKLRNRLTKPQRQFKYLDYPVFENEQGEHVLTCYEHILNMLKSFENDCFQKWTSKMKSALSLMSNPLLIRNEKDLCSNFDNQLASILIETKGLLLMEYEGVSSDFTRLFEREPHLWELRLKLSRIIEWYNDIINKTVPCEMNLIEEEMVVINDELTPALTSMNWNNYEPEYIDGLYNQLKNIHERVMTTQKNLRLIFDDIRSWGTKPLYIRRNNNPDALLDISSRDATVHSRLTKCINTKKLIDRKIDENFRLFNNLPLELCPCSSSSETDTTTGEEEKIPEVIPEVVPEDKPEEIKITDNDNKQPDNDDDNDDDDDDDDIGSADEEVDSMSDDEYLASMAIGKVNEVAGKEEIEKSRKVQVARLSQRVERSELERTPSQKLLWRPYQEYVDELVATEIMDAIYLSMKYIKFEMENRLEHDSPLFLVNFELQPPYMTYMPNFDTASKYGFLVLIEGIIIDIYSMCDMIPRVAQPPEEERTAKNGDIYIATYETILNKNQRIQSMRDDIIMQTKLTMMQANTFAEQFRQYEYLWLDNKQLYLEQFVKYGRALTYEESELIGTEDFKVKPMKPTLDMFREEIDQYDVVYHEVEKINDHITFQIWLKCNFKGFKYGLLNEIAAWKMLFKNYLKQHDIDSLNELEQFIEEAVAILSLELTEENLDALLKVLSILSKIEERQLETDMMFDPIRAEMDLLKFYNISFPDNFYIQFAELPNKWMKLKKSALSIKQVIVPIQTYQMGLIGKHVLLFEARAKMYRRRFRASSLFKVNCPNVYELIENIHTDLTSMEEQLQQLYKSTDLFAITKPDADDVIRCRKEVKLVKLLWDIVFVIQSSINNWKKTPWKKIDVESMDRECKLFTKDLRALDKEVRTWDPYIGAEASLKNLITSLRAVTELRNPAIRDRHWQELMCTTKVQFSMDKSTTLANLLDLNLHKYEDDVKNIVDKSVKEMAMEKVLKDLDATWATMEFEHELHSRTQLQLLRASEELIEVLEDNQVQLQNMLSSKFIGYFLVEVTEWQSQLSTADQVIGAWFEVQRKWMYLESIFIGSEDIRKQLPVDSKRFDEIDTEFKELLEIMVPEPNVLKATNTPNLFDRLEVLEEKLIRCEKALNDYLETKRLEFPRFYFVSAADLLDILSNGNQPELVGRHLTKLYDSLAKLELKSGSKNAFGMISKENEEHVKFKALCDCSGQVEVWLNRVTDTMKETLRSLFSDSVFAYDDKPRDQWIMDWPAQTALCTTQIKWSSETNVAFSRLEEGYENALKDYQKKQINQLNALIMLLLGQLTPGERQKIMTVCTIDVHSRDVVAKLIATKIENVYAFQWQSQLRHTWDYQLNDCFVYICDARFKYDFEYLGNTPRLVITPLTDRCYITLTQSLHLIMGGAPAGPAGTGKTETTKDLGKGLGIMVYVFNCSEQMDYKSCGNIYKGLAQTGAWGCFDEFNRISVEVLSVVSVQVKTILDAIKNKKAIFMFMGEKIKLINTVGMFITMNPGYAGRTELPENLKALFRPCAMVVPDFALISEIMLVAEGFQEARLLSRKFITLYTLCKELLSKQDHYDWGLRAIKSVLVVAGALRRNDRDRPEDQVLMRALRDFNIPKIVTEDVPIFMGLIGDLFPNLDVPRKRDVEFENIVKKSALDLHLQPEDGFVLKIVQLEELFAVRHSVFIVGLSGTGKSEVWKTLHRTYFNQKRKPHYNDLNPKAVTNDELFGIINQSTREWKDGLFSVIMRDQTNMRGDGPKWIVLDGDIDPMWIESLNTLMDDNKILTLASNERIALTKEMRLLFEIATLRAATPATVSRAGILYINPQDLGWNPYVASWIETRELQIERSTLTVLFDRYVPPLLEIMKHKFKKITPISEIAMIQMTCHLLDCLLTTQNCPIDCPKEWYEIYFTFAIIWGFGSTLFQNQIIDWRNEFNKWWLNEFKTIKFPAGGNIFNYFIDPDTKAFMPWTKLVPKFELDPDIPLQATLVNTAETTRLRYFMDMLIQSKHPVMLVGSSGSGKSVIVSDKLNTLSANYAVTNVPFNFYTTSEMLQQALEQPLEKKAGRNYGPPGNKKMVYFIDDMNMPKVDIYGTVQAHTLVRQFMDYRHWYDRIKLSLKDIRNCQFVSCMNPTAGAFTINPRLQRHFCTFAVNFPGTDAMFHIYYNILSQHLAHPLHKFSAKVQAICEPLIRTAIVLHQRVNQTFLPTAAKFHYIFNLRDMANIFSGMMFAKGDCCPNPNMLIRLWTHEVTRVYGDKLVNFTDIDTFNKLVVEVTRKAFEELNEDIVFEQPNLFFHFAEGLNDAKYMPVKGWEALSKILLEAQNNYNELIGAMNLVLFEDAMGHICRISRIMANDRGCALLIGVGGSGKQSLTRLSALISSVDVFQTQLRKGFTITDLKADLADLYIKTGIKSTPCCYLMTDSQVAEEEFLVVINDLLASGEIQDLFPPEDIDNIVGGIRNEAKQFGIMDTKENCWQFFIDKVRRLLKIVLSFSPVGSTLRVRARKFPAIVNCSAIDWFNEWPQNALKSVSKRFLADIDILPTELTESVSNFMAYVHKTVNDMSEVYLLNERRYNYTTPKSFLELISLYSKLLQEKHREINDRIIRLEKGLLKLADCANQVAGLQEQLKEQEVVLNIKREEANKQHAIVSAENDKVQVERNIASQKEKDVRIIEEDVSIKAKLCAEDLKKAEPVLNAAIAALDTLNRDNLTELKSFGSPPQAVINVCSAVLVLLSNKGKIPKDRSWKACKVMMNKVDKFLDDLKFYDKKNIQPHIIAELEKYLKDPQFDPTKVQAKSKAAGGLCEWVVNIHKFYDVYLIVGPKERALNAAESELRNAQNTLAELNRRLEELQVKLDVLQGQLDAASAEKEKCQAEADKTEFTIQLAHRLVDGLASEKVRWKESVNFLKKQLITLPGDILLISCFISYVGCFTRGYRLDLQNKYWIPTFEKIEPKIPVSETSDPLKMICDDAQIAFWNNEGLPSDRMSAENATILTNSARWPLMIDPQLQGIKWIKQKYGSELIIIRLTMRNYLDIIERAIINGSIVLLENIGETIDVVLDPLLERALVKKGRCIKIGDREIDYNRAFRLILHTKLANPHYKPEMQAQTTLINFTVTRDGLEEQLLAEVVKAERPDLEQLKTNLTMQQNNFKIDLKSLEDDLLQRLSSAGENVLDDPTLVLNLERTKKMAAEIEIKVEEAKLTSKRIDNARELYRIAATRASIIYFILNDLYKVNRIYQFSLKAFVIVFNNAIHSTKSADEILERVANLIDSITYAVFRYTTRALFERDKLIFMAQMTIQILLQADKIQSSDLDFLLRFPYAPNVVSPLDFISHIGWGGIKTLSNMLAFRNLDKDIEGSYKRWRTFTESECPEREKFPGEWKNKNVLQRLCIMRALRPDRMTYAITAFVDEVLGTKYIESRVEDFAETFKETSNSTHTFFTLSPGVDPLKDVEKLGKKMRFSSDFGNFYNISLGQGQEIVAENAMDVASENGHWVILQNVHLVAKWLPTLEKKIEATSESSHENYRLFITAEPASSAEYHIIPQGVLESAIKLTNEPPTGMLANLHKSLDNFSQDTLEMCSKETEFKAILFSLCYFHAVVAERRKFGPQGWNRIYPFNFGDLTISVYVLYNYLEATNNVPWEDLRYLFGEIMYGGHITDDWDRRLCSTFLEEYMQNELVDGELYLAPGFLAPPNLDYDGYHQYIDTCLPSETPILYGLHPNAEIGVLTTLSDELFKTIFELQPRDTGASAGVTVSREDTVKQLIEDIIDKIPEEFNLFEIMARVENRTPFIIVAFQECDRMNILMREIRRSLNELFSGLKGELTITTDMEKLEESVFFDTVPENWTKLAYPSLLGLQAWFADLILRLRELEAWSADFNLPPAVWLAGFFNPQSFLTAIMQQTARKNGWPLDKMCLNCDVTKKQKQDFSAPPREGAYVHGLYMEGARWDIKVGTIADSLIKELFPLMPVVYLKAVTQDKHDVKNVYECPVYKIRMRGPTYVWTFNLKTKQKASKWTMAGVCLLLQP